MGRKLATRHGAGNPRGAGYGWGRASGGYVAHGGGPPAGGGGGRGVLGSGLRPPLSNLPGTSGGTGLRGSVIQASSMAIAGWTYSLPCKSVRRLSPRALTGAVSAFVYRRGQRRRGIQRRDHDVRPRACGMPQIEGRRAVIRPGCRALRSISPAAGRKPLQREGKPARSAGQSEADSSHRIISRVNGVDKTLTAASRSVNGRGPGVCHGRATPLSCGRSRTPPSRPACV